MVEHVSHVAVVNPSQFKVISQSVKKTDKNDAELLALYLGETLIKLSISTAKAATVSADEAEDTGDDEWL